jgi:hypothetical protein
MSIWWTVSRCPGVSQIGQGAGGEVVDHVDGVALGQ